MILFKPIRFTLYLQNLSLILWIGALSIAIPIQAQTLNHTQRMIDQALQFKEKGQTIQAIKLLDPLAYKGEAVAQVLMGELREQSNTPESLLKARNWYAIAALSDHTDAQYRLSQLLQSGKLPEIKSQPLTPLSVKILAGQQENLAAANYWLERAANLENQQAEYTLAQQLEKQNKITAALYWYEKAAEQNYPPALNTLAAMAWEGKLISHDIRRAGQLYKQAANLGYPPAMFNLAAMMANKQIDGDNDLMIQWLRRSAELGYANAQLQLGYLLLYGDQTEQNEQEAAKLFHAAAEQNNGWAQYYLAILYQKGRGIPRDLDISRKWFERAAQEGIAPAQYELGLIYLNGLSILSDQHKAKFWIQQAADKGLPEAKAILSKFNSSEPFLSHEKSDTAN